MYAAGIALGLSVVVPYARQRGLKVEDVSAVAWGTGVAALVGGRLYYIVQTNPSWYLAHPVQIFAVWQGGMAFYGALFFGAPAVILLARRRHLHAGALLDTAALFAPLSQAVGRIGNVINGDIVGYPSALPWATVYINPHNRFVRLGVAFQPAAAYELLFSLVLFGVLWRWRDRAWPPGTLCYLYLVLYAVGQFVLFYGRANALVAFDLRQAQLTSIVVVVVVVPLLIRALRGASGAGHPANAPLQAPPKSRNPDG